MNREKRESSGRRESERTSEIEGDRRRRGGSGVSGLETGERAGNDRKAEIYTTRMNANGTTAHKLCKTDPNKSSIR